jgi:dTDP-4-amino-4,6-dideoxygalactose transaminase
MPDRPAILRGTPLRAGKSWPAWPQWDDSERELLNGVLDSGAWSSSRGGEQAAAWAAEFAAAEGVAAAIPVTNGTHTLEAALAACEVGEGDEVIVPALTFVATATAALAVNATPVIVDVEADSLCIDVEAAAAAVTERTKAIVAVHLAGRAADLDALEALCRARGLVLIGDCAHAQGTRWRGRGVGSYGAFGSYSFEAHKLITAGEGGALTTGDEALRARAWSYVNVGRVEGGHWYHHPTYGSNMRLSEWQGAILRAQLRRFPEQHRTREARAATLDEALGGVEGLRPQAGDERMDSRARYAYVLHYEPVAFDGLPLAAMETALRAEGIDLSGPYPSLATLELFRERRFGPRLRAGAPTTDYAALDLPAATAAVEGTIWIPHHVLLAGEEDVLDIPRAFERIKASAGEVARRVEKGEPLSTRLAGSVRRLRARPGATR